MPRQAKLHSTQGLLLVEAVLSAVVIAVGLVFIGRSFSSQLRAISTIEEYEMLLELARGKLLELETKRVARPIPSEESYSGNFPAPHEAYGWEVSAQLREDLADEAGEVWAGEVTLLVQRLQGNSKQIRLQSIWPVTWIPEEWIRS
ncbi:MAG: hypothetical protein HYT88_03340 [Candidatus Omnitrophica bacterium]|nr:hypothetical protein [Candidatus Omnitrophota bacterium]MBI2173853.1 hypothetical protein [Candidatus Omnitrophota bacterium]MBI3009412.1 hypothetical protein [Candidatus Omnitrophota bacterium]